MLSGEWDFCFLTSFERIGREKLRWSKTSVPSCWQTQGYEPPFYVNDDFTCPAIPPRVPNATPVGIYRRVFEYLPPADCTNAILTFLGVCSAFHVFINGKEVGYGSGSHSTNEFNIGPYVRAGENEIEVYVYKWSAGSFLESQDMFRYNGIFRDVYITYLPGCSVYDFHWKTVMAENGAYDCFVDLQFWGGGAECSVALQHSGRKICESRAENGRCTFRVENPVLWNAESPALYDLIIRLWKGGKETECVYERVGFKTVGYAGPQFLVNGVPVKLKGVNMHESHCKNGYTVTDEECERDIRLAKSLNVNTIRFSHYPPNPVMLRLCDEYGVYVVDEADLETYGSANMEDIDYFGKASQWLPAFLDRMEHLWERDKNHACVVMWSMGNEAGRGENFDRCYEYLKSKDENIPVHYETCFRYEGENGYDIVTLQYSDFSTIEKWMKAEDKRPFFLCEYGHCMGAGPGSLKEYWEYVYRYDQFIGGCIWEWCDHAYLQNREETDIRKFEYTYGGDHGEYIHDRNFCCDGMVYPDRSLSPAALEVKNVYRPVRAALAGSDAGGCTLEFFNTNSFTDASAYRIVLRKKRNGSAVEEEEISLSLPPFGKLRRRIPFEDDDFERVVETEVYRGAESCGFDSFVLEERLPQYGGPGTPVVRKMRGGASVRAGGAVWKFDEYLCTFTQVRFGGKGLFSEKPQNKGYGAFCRNVAGMFPSIWRAPIDNDRPYIEDYQLKLYDEMWLSFYERHFYTENGCSVFEQTGYLTPPKYSAMYAVSTKYAADGCGLKVTAVLTPLQDGLPPLPRFGMRMQLAAGMKHVRWYGLGFSENYPDFREGCRYGIYSADAEELHEPYIRPQENGTRGGVRWLEVTDESGVGLRFTALCAPFSFSLRPYSLEDLEKAEHRGELPRRSFNELSVEGFTRGLGSASCGLRPLEQYLIPQKKGEPIRFEFAVSPVVRSEK